MSSGLKDTVEKIILVVLFSALCLMILSQFLRLDQANYTGTNSNGFVYISPSILSPVGEGVSSVSVSAPANVSLVFDGVDDYLAVKSLELPTIAFWYKNETSEWIFVTNVSGTTYVNGLANTPDEYPVYYNGTDYEIGKTNESAFFSGNVDEFSGFLNELSSDEVLALYQGGI